jgi:uncharacterized protein YjiS (DUF1127 family)
MTTLIMTADRFGLRDLARWLKELNAKLEYNRAARSTIKQLSKLTDRELNDIGIARGDIYGVAYGDTTLERVRRMEADANSNLKGWV